MKVTMYNRVMDCMGLQPTHPGDIFPNEIQVDTVASGRRKANESSGSEVHGLGKRGEYIQMSLQQEGDSASTMFNMPQP